MLNKLNRIVVLRNLLNVAIDMHGGVLCTESVDAVHTCSSTMVLTPFARSTRIQVNFSQNEHTQVSIGNAHTIATQTHTNSHTQACDTHAQAVRCAVVILSIFGASVLCRWTFTDTQNSGIVEYHRLKRCRSLNEYNAQQFMCETRESDENRKNDFCLVGLN